jgi:hypothetical protein
MKREKMDWIEKMLLKDIARIHCASVIRAIEVFNVFDGSVLTSAEKRYIDEEIEIISDRLLRGDKPAQDSIELAKDIMSKRNNNL